MRFSGRRRERRHLAATSVRSRDSAQRSSNPGAEVIMIIVEGLMFPEVTGLQVGQIYGVFRKAETIRWRQVQ